MKIAVYGATGMVGSQIANECLARGREVTALSRTGPERPGVRSRAADLADAGTFAELHNPTTWSSWQRFPAVQAVITTSGSPPCRVPMPLPGTRAC